MAANAMHLAKSAEHYTPEPWPAIARELMGGIDLDPASCAEANETIGAARYFTAADDGLSRAWSGRVFLNSPGRCGDGFPGCGPVLASGKRRKSCSCGLVLKFWNKLAHDLMTGAVEQCFYVGFTVFQLQTLQAGEYGGPLSWVCSGRAAMLIPDRRISYGGSSPTHPSFLLHVRPQGRTASTYGGAYTDLLWRHGEVIGCGR